MKKSPVNGKNSGDAFRDAFSRKLSGYKAEPTPDLWSRIELSLEKDEAIAYKEKWKLYSRLAAASLALLLTIGGVLFYNYNNSLNETKLAGAGEMQGQQTGTNSEETVAFNQKNAAGNSETSADSGSEAEKTTAENNPTSAAQVAGNSGNPAANEQALNSEIKNQFGKQTTKNLPIAVNTKTENKNTSEITENINSGAQSRKINNATIPVIIAGNTKVLKGSKTASGIGNIIVSREKGNMSSTSNPETPTKSVTPENAATAKTDGNANTPEATPVVAINSSSRNTTVKNGQGIDNLKTGIALTAENAAPKAHTATVVSNKEMALLQTKNPLSKTDTTKQELPVLAVLVDTVKPAEMPEIPVKPLSRWSVGAFYSVHQFHQNLNLSTPLPEVGSPKVFLVSQKDLSLLYAAEKEYNNNTEAAFSWQGKIHAAYQLFPKWQVQTGLLYAVNQSKTASSYIIRQHENASPVIVATLSSENERGRIETTEDFTINYKYQYIGLPVKMQFQSNINYKAFGFASGGFIINYLSQATITNSFSGSEAQVYKSSGYTPFRTWQVATTGSAGFGYRLTRQLSIAAGAEASYFVEPLVNQEKLSIRGDQPFTFGFTTGLIYNFNLKPASKK